jgi:hypothetical protein
MGWTPTTEANIGWGPVPEAAGGGPSGLSSVEQDLTPIADLTYTYDDDGIGGRMLVGAGALSGVTIWNESALVSLEESVTGGYWEATLDLTGLPDTKYGKVATSPGDAPAIVWPCFGDGSVEVDAEIMAGHSDANFGAIFAVQNAGTPANAAAVASLWGAWYPIRPHSAARIGSWQLGGVGTISSPGNPQRRVVLCERTGGSPFCANSASWGSGWLKKDLTSGKDELVAGDVAGASCHAGVGLGGNTNDVDTVIRIYRIRTNLYPWPA